MKIEDFLEVNQKLEITVWRQDDGDDEGQTYQTYIKDIQDDMILVHPPSAGEAGLYELMTRGTKVGAVMVQQGEGQIVFYPIIESQQTQGLIGFWMVVGDDLQHEVMQRRRHVRIPIGLTIRLALTVEGETAQLEARTLDISGGGVRFYCRHEFQKGQVLVATIPFESGEVVTVNARVVLCNESNKYSIDGGYFTTAASFDEITEQQESTLVSECFKHELKLRRDGKI